METGPRPQDAAEALRASEQARAGLAHSLVTPPGHDVVIGAAVAVQVATMALGLAVADAWARGVLVAGVLVFGVAAAVELVRFRRRNGVRLDGFTSRAVLGTDAAASIAYAVGAATTYLAASREVWWLVGLLALAAGTAYALAGRRWLRRYRDQPAERAGAESTALLVLVGLVAVVGLVLLVVSSS
ncbi:hypothetical protein [Cellulomonas edaphi]|uniref:DUF202 domain-containing protein n=1 Tax=Cellulomonas edaphi TaxID=3053468 RepID=A0ABT7S3H2_9CELL|nr:hypothetical protein [Cellulomons edaphi]MDM7830079.1 hypothetical protein [Cellulomons edaphi]